MCQLDQLKIWKMQEKLIEDKMFEIYVEELGVYMSNLMGLRL